MGVMDAVTYLFTTGLFGPLYGIGIGIFLSLVLRSVTEKKPVGEVAATIAEGLTYGLFRRRNPDLAETFARAGIIDSGEARLAQQRGWTDETAKRALTAVLDSLLTSRWPTVSGTGPGVRLAFRAALTQMSAEAFEVFAYHDNDLWMEDPRLAQEWFATFGERALRLVDAGLSLPEAVALRDAGRLDEESLTTLAALRAPAVTSGRGPSA